MNDELWDKNNLVCYLKQNGLWAQKGLSQNFLINKNALNKIVEAAEIKPDDLIIEIGPGTGILTMELIKRAGEVIAIEQDEKLAGLLPEMTKSKLQISNKIQNDKNLKIINSDILKVNLNELIGERKYKVVANIPYHITSKILELFLSRENRPELLVLLVQKEVAERICATEGEMSVLSISVQLYGKPEIIDIVPKESFYPSPKVDSAILKIGIMNYESGIMESNKGDKSAIDEKAFFRLVHIGFAARRKTLVNNLSAGYHISKETASDIIKSAGLKENVRAQELGISKWRELCLKVTRKTT